MKRTAINIVFTGHVDHGKSTLIGRLLIDTDSLPESKIEEVTNVSKELGKEAELAYVTDYLKEEREQNITIDTTQIHFKTRKRDYIIIDAPGHIEFIKNMITGTSQAEAAVLIVDVNEGVLEQTRRHVYLLNLLGIEKIVVVINKMDLVGFIEKRYLEVKDEIMKFLDELSLKPLCVIPISAREGENITHKSRIMPWYRGPCFLKALDYIRPDKVTYDKLPLRFPVQDIYLVDGNRIIVGKVASGYLHKGQEVVVLPSGEMQRVESIKTFNKDKKKAETFESIGICLHNTASIERGSILSQRDDVPKLSNTFNATVFWMSETPWIDTKPHELQCSTQEVTCRLDSITKKMNSSTLELLNKDMDRLLRYEVGEVVIKTERPVLTESFDYRSEFGRFVVKDEGYVVGVGIIM
ncbi:MAG: GTP-binding protein [Spirochaetota bacterium]|nr:MAG: GTP-binding protein [Spirochaetota bacterium]